MKDENFLSRWSRRKIEAKGEPADAPDTEAAGAAAADAALPETPAAPAEVSRPLPPLESLTSGSDFAPFMQPEVDQDMRRRALKTLFGDSRLYPMDGLDVYIDDYSKPDPLPEGWLDRLEQLAQLHAPRPPEAGAVTSSAAAAAVAADAAGDAAAADGQAPGEGPASDTSDAGHSPNEGH